MMSDLASMSYGDLLAHLRKDLQLDLSTDALLPPILPSQAARWDIDIGTLVLNFAASTNSGTVTVLHHLTRVPVSIAAVSFAAPAFGNIPLPNVVAKTDKQFTINGEVKTAFTGNVTLLWIALG